MPEPASELPQSASRLPKPPLELLTKLTLCAPGQDVVIQFSRAPVPGQVKTRLFSHLSPEQACALHAATTADVAVMLQAHLPRASKWLAWSAPPDGEGFAFPAETGVETGTALQTAGDLGARMASAIEHALQCGAGRVLLIGSDSPTLPPENLTHALALLSEADLVFGPTLDGGFYLVACRRFTKEIFQGVPWSSCNTLSVALSKATQLGYSVRSTSPWFDVDEWADVERLLAARNRGEWIPKFTAEWLHRNFPEGRP